jgi:hypothetical protein
MSRLLLTCDRKRSPQEVCPQMGRDCVSTFPLPSHKERSPHGWYQQDDQGINYQAVKDAANAIQGKDGRVKSARQAMAKQVLADFNQKQMWVENTLGMTHQQKKEHKQEKRSKPR